MKLVEKNPIIMIILGVMGISLSSIFLGYATAPSAVTAAYRLLWTVLFLTPAVFIKKENRNELIHIPVKMVILSCLSGLFLAIHFVLWFESLKHTSVAASTAIVCTEAIWVALGFLVFLKGKLSWKAALAIAVTLGGSVLIALADSNDDGRLYGDILALLAAIAVAGYTLIGRVVRSSVSTTIYTYIVYLTCSVALVVTCLVCGYNLVGYGWNPVIIGLLLAVFSTILGHSIFSWCLRFFSPAFVSSSKLCEPVVAGVLAAILFRQFPGWQQILGGVVILGGMVYYSLLETRKDKN